MLATLRDTKGLGNSALYVRARDATGRYWDWVGLAWGNTETTDCRKALTEYADSDTAESRYSTTVSLPAADGVLEYVRASDAVVRAEESFTSATGSGAGLMTVTVDNGTDPVEGATVLLVDQASGVTAATGTTNASGQVVLAHGGGAYRLVVIRAAMTFPVTSLSLTETSSSQTVHGTAQAVSPSADPAECVLFATLRNLDGTARAGVVGTLQLVKVPTVLSGSYFVGQEIQATSAGNGIISWAVPRLSVTRVSIPGFVDRLKVTAPNAETYDLAGV